MSKMSASPSGERTLTLALLQSTIMDVTVSLGRPWTRSIYSIFLRCMELNTLKKSTNKGVTSRFFAWVPSGIRRSVRICDAVDQFLRKPFRSFKNFSNIWFDTIEKQIIINLGLNRSKLCLIGSWWFQVNFLWKGKDAVFYQYLYCVLAVYGFAKSK